MITRVRAIVASVVVALVAALGSAIPATADPLPDPGELVAIMNAFSNPAVPGANKAGEVEGGLDVPAVNALDASMRLAERRGEFPLSYSAANITSLGPNRVSADITVSGPRIPQGVTRPVRFFYDGGRWLLGQDSALELITDAVTVLPGEFELGR